MILVLSVIAGVVVAVATVPARPLAETTETLVTVPDPAPVAAIVMLLPAGVTVIPVPATMFSAPARLFKELTPPPPPPVLNVGPKSVD